MQHSQNRRNFLKSASASAVAASLTPHLFPTTSAFAQGKSNSPNERVTFGCIGTGARWGIASTDRLGGIGRQVLRFGDLAVVSDLDSERMEKARVLSGGTAKMSEDYRRILDRKDIDAVTIVTPDHWHTKIAIDAMKAGKDVYCEKPLTLTIEEGKQICQVVRETGRVFQVGTQQRSIYNNQFLKFIGLAHSGRLGKIKRVTVAIGDGPTSGPIPVAEAPSTLNWNQWLGQAPLVDFRMKADDSPWNKTRGHYEFRWWFEYSGGKLTDWGAHHVDIAQWAIGMDHSGPDRIEPIMEEVEFPSPMEKGMPTLDDRYNTASKFRIRCFFANGVEMDIRDRADDLGFENGIMLEGEKGRIFVNRGKLTGKAVEELANNPLPEGTIEKLYKGKQPGAHMGNFVECIADREQPVSDVFTHHRILTTCHLANIAIRLGRPLRWDPKKEQILGDPEANAWQSREQRKGFEITV
ncbi:NADH-dependent dehydrogenase [Planctomycetales bacterium 10988]|nr:NADH-dependent dehydrogenase [Planctomycetales bacterium 10988]